MPHKRAPKVTHDDPSMRGERGRAGGGDLRRKRSDTHVGTVEEQYHVDFGVRSDMHLGTLLEREGVGSLSEMLKKQRGR